MMPIEFRRMMPVRDRATIPAGAWYSRLSQTDGWVPVCRLLLLMTPAVALAAVVLIAEPWSLAAFLTAGAGTLAICRGLSIRHQPNNSQTAGNPPGIDAGPNGENNDHPQEE